MTVDAAITKWDNYRDALTEDVFRVAEYEYTRLALQFPVVDEQEFISFVYNMLYIEYRDQLVEEALARGDHRIYGMSKTDFIVKSYDSYSDKDNMAVNPFIQQDKFREALELYINQNNLVLHNYDEVWNSPIQEVW